jgi:hypothetical protein
MSVDVNQSLEVEVIWRERRGRGWRREAVIPASKYTLLYAKGKMTFYHRLKASGLG